MSATLLLDSAHRIYEFRVSGYLSRKELEECEEQLSQDIIAGVEPRLLVLLDNFLGWEDTHDWDNLDFMLAHGMEKITRIAIVGARNELKSEIKVFTGDGIRAAPVQFFQLWELDKARAWLGE